MWQKKFLYVGGHQTVFKELLRSQTGLRLIRARLIQSERTVSNQCPTVHDDLFHVSIRGSKDYYFRVSVYHAATRHDWLTHLIESK